MQEIYRAQTKHAHGAPFHYVYSLAQKSGLLPAQLAHGGLPPAYWHMEELYHSSPTLGDWRGLLQIIAHCTCYLKLSSLLTHGKAFLQLVDTHGAAYLQLTDTWRGLLSLHRRRGFPQAQWHTDQLSSNLFTHVAALHSAPLTHGAASLQVTELERLSSSSLTHGTAHLHLQ